MRFYVLSGEADILLGLGLAGMQGEIVKSKDELRQSLSRLSSDASVAVILISEEVVNLAPDIVTSWKLRRNKPLLVEIPGPNDSHDISKSIAEYISATIGIKID